MAISRYKNVDVIDNKFFGSLEFPSEEDLENVNTFSIRANASQRLDNIAAKHLGNSEYWWVIAVMNDISWPWDYQARRHFKNTC